MRWRRASDEPRSAPLRHHHLAGDHREGDDRLGAQPGDLQGRPQGDQAADQGSGGEAVRRQGEERQHPDPQGQDQGLQGHLRRAVGRQESDRDPGRGPPHRRDDRACKGRKRDNGTQDLQTRHAEPAPARPGRPLRRSTRASRSSSSPRDRARVGRAQQQRPHHRALPRRRPQAGLSAGRLQAAQVRRAGEDRAHRIRPEPHRLHRAPEVRGRRALLHPGAAAAGGRATWWWPASTST